VVNYLGLEDFTGATPAIFIKFVIVSAGLAKIKLY
jgi:hypothetical protein